MPKNSEQPLKIEYLEQLYNDYGPDIMRFLTRKVGPNAAPDLLQDTFVQTLLHFDKLNTVISPKAWLMKIAYNLTCNYYRQQKKKHIELKDDYSIYENYSEDTRLEHIREIIHSLPDRHKEVIMLKWYDQLCYEDISQILEIPIGTVRSRLHNSMKKIKQKFDHTKTEDEI